MSTNMVGVRVKPEVLVATREALGLPEDTKDLDTIRAALSHITGIAPSQMRKPQGGVRTPRRHRAQAA